MILDCHIYRYALVRDDLSIGSKVLWSYYCTQASVMVLSVGKDLDELLAERGGMLCLEGMTYANIPGEMLGMSRHRWNVAMSELRDAGLYRDDMLYFPLDMQVSGFFELRSKPGMTPWDIVLYSWILDRIEYGGGTMTDVTNAAIGASLGLTEYSVRKRKAGLYARGWLEAVRRGQMVYCADPELAKVRGYIEPKVSSRKSSGPRLNLDRF